MLTPERFCYGNSTYNSSDKQFFIDFRIMCKYYLSWILPLIITTGIFGSVFCLIFLLCSKLFPKNLLIWLVSICVGDLMILLLDGIWMALKMWFAFDIRDVNDFFCVTHKFLSNYFFYWSAYMQTMVSIQRAYLIMRPIQARMNLVLPKLATIWAVLSVVLVLPHVIYVVKWRVRDGDCDPPDKISFHFTSLCDMIIWGVIPFLSMMVSTVIITVNVCSFQSRVFRPGIAAPKVVYSFVKNNPSTFIGGHQIIPSETSSLNSHSLKVNNSVAINREISPEYLSTSQTSSGRRHGGVDTAKHVTQLLIGMNMCYLLTTFPFLIFLIYLNFANPDFNSWRRKFFYYLLRSFSFYNTCSNWIFYCAAGRLFRNTAKQIIKKLFCSRCSTAPFTSSSQASGGVAFQNKFIHNPKL